MTWQWLVFACWTVAVLAFVALVIYFAESEERRNDRDPG